MERNVKIPEYETSYCWQEDSKLINAKAGELAATIAYSNNKNNEVKLCNVYMHYL